MSKESITLFPLLKADQELANSSDIVVIGGGSLTPTQILAVARANSPVELTKSREVLDRISYCHGVMMQNVQDGVPVYGCNTGYGAQASAQVSSGSGYLRDMTVEVLGGQIAPFIQC